MALPATLSYLSTREAVIDAVYRAVIAFDTADDALLESAMTDDAVMDLNGRVMEGKNSIRTEIYEPVSKLDTTHFVTNIRVDVKAGETEASVTSHILAQHYRQGQGLKPDATRFLVGGQYFIELMKDKSDGLWKSKHWRVKSIWNEGDVGVMTGH